MADTYLVGAHFQDLNEGVLVTPSDLHFFYRPNLAILTILTTLQSKVRVHKNASVQTLGHRVDISVPGQGGSHFWLGDLVKFW